MSLDPVLFHYTDAAGAIGILGTSATSSRIWLTQQQYLNDDSEYYHAFELARNTIIARSDEWPNVRRVMSGIWGIPHDPIQTQIEPFNRANLGRVFSFSLSEAEDLLSQWRGYAPYGGYSIGFRASDLRNVAWGNKLRFDECVYEDSDKTDKITSLMSSVEIGIRTGQINYFPGIEDLTDADRVDATARFRIQTYIAEYAAYFKSSGFREEREWRIVGVIIAQDPRSRYRGRGGAIIPYAELDIGADSVSPLTPCSIIVGPGVDFVTAKHALEFMRYDMLGQIDIKASALTFRR